jgi:cation:H+ antiporter
MVDALLLFLGVLAAALGGELFVRGAVGLASISRVPPGIIGATVAAAATSTPELSVAINAAATGQPEIPLGDAIGSNVTNVGLVLAVAIAFVPLTAWRRDLRRDIPFALLAPAATGLLLIDGSLSRVDGAVLLSVFVAWLVIAVMEAKRVRDATPAVLGDRRLAITMVRGAAGIALLVIAGRLIVVAARGFGETLGIDSFVVGATLVAAGTSAPELATALIAGLRGHAEIGLGTIIGSNIINNLFIVGTTSLIAPIHPAGTEVAIALVASAALVLAAIPGPSGRLGRARGVPLAGGYAAYVVVLLAAT